MFKNLSKDGKRNICGKKIREIRKNLPKKTSQNYLSSMLQINGLDIDKNAIQQIESGQRFVTDIELKAIAKALDVSYEELLDYDE
ncbi:helix-turn-helix transcriptional regulator [Blautia liquoris]|jgi:transcriptional regulator with XRE-family HTH domain|uniref:Helix-turn-helix transcriptional regulator n=1 Tax=Blautia liquoris TaxID=2779518 RepID=A0A7M2RF32_9FIRM|nr:helix-turn-helix transcriptional regulator [Blautia liquoris]QOV18859.1 helix-turn-helix transcriptional regulator [Blautia liquoris]